MNLARRQRNATRHSPGWGTAFGTFGELLQGVLPGSDLDFLVALPITLSSRASFVSDSELEELLTFPPHKCKSRRLATRILDHFGLPPGGVLVVDSDLPEGKGMASSSADLVATARAVEACFGLEVPIDLLLAFMAEIEPSDGVMYNGIVVFYHREVRLCEFLGALAPLAIVAVDEGGEVDTVEFNRIPKPFGQADKEEYARLLRAVTTAIRQGDLETVGQVATRSAVLNQRLRPKSLLAPVEEVCRSAGGLGVAVAHSGTCLGVLLSPDDPRYTRQLPVVYEGLREIAGAVRVHHSLDFRLGSEK